MSKNNGVTLIALVITIVVLIILAGVSFSFVLGDNNIIDASKEYVSESEKKMLVDEMGILLLKYKVLKMDSDISIIEYFDSFDSEDGFTGVTDNGDGTYTIHKGKIEILINENEVIDIK